MPTTTSPHSATRTRPRSSRSGGDQPTARTHPHARPTPAASVAAAPYTRSDAVGYRVLIATRQPDAAASLAGSLAALGFTVTVTYDLARLHAQAASNDAIVVDLCTLRDSPELAQTPLRAAAQSVALIALGADSDSETSAIAAGFDDAVALPWPSTVLAARIVNAIKARASTTAAIATPRPPQPQMRVDREARIVEYGERSAHLSPTEWTIFSALVERRGATLERETLMRLVYGDGARASQRALDVRVFHLRRKLGDPLARAIQTLPGVGWRLIGIT